MCWNVRFWLQDFCGLGFGLGLTVAAAQKVWAGSASLNL